MVMPTRLATLGLLVVASICAAQAETLAFPDPSDSDKTLDELIAEADSEDTILIAPGVYAVDVNIDKSLILRGEETARTVLKGECSTGDDARTCNGSGDIININPSSDAGGIDVRIQNLTFLDASRAIVVDDNVNSVEIYNNVFIKSDTSNDFTGVDIVISTEDDVDTDISIVHNTFYKNTVALSVQEGSSTITPVTDVSIVNNIFDQNKVSVDSASLQKAGVRYNGYVEVSGDTDSVARGNYFGTAATTTGNVRVSISDSDEQYSKVSSDDIDGYRFILHPNSDFKNVGARDVLGGNNDDSWIADESSVNAAPDFGAFGGKYADGKFAPVEIITAVVPANGNQVTITWEVLDDVMIEDAGGVASAYKFYRTTCDPSSSGCDLDDADSNKEELADVSGTGYNIASSDSESTGTLVANFNVPVVNASAPFSFSLDGRNSALLISWTPPDNVLSYDYALTFTDSGDSVALPARSPDPFLDATTKSYLQEGLLNETEYTVSLTPTYQAIVYFSGQLAKSVDGGDDVESEITRVKMSRAGAASTALAATVETEFAEIPVMYPILPDEGCFIATAAYGSYFTEELLVLRHFRDKHLLTSAWGSQFVAWYYQRGPIGASWLNRHSTLKPVVRTALYPLVMAAQTIIAVGWWGFAALNLMLISMVIIGSVKWRDVKRGKVVGGIKTCK